MCQYEIGGLRCNMATRIIRKYGNRRLYDTTGKCYVNLDEIAQMIRSGDELQVLDTKTGEDLTRGILTQIIVEQTRSRNGGLPLEILRELIALSDKAQHDVLAYYLRTALETYRRAQQAPVEFMRTLFLPRSQDSAQVEELRRRIEELERRLSVNSSE
jgi:polyhydroxyalkanoate synthesis repressor PhaR